MHASRRSLQEIQRLPVAAAAPAAVELVQMRSFFVLLSEEL